MSASQEGGAVVHPALVFAEVLNGLSCDDRWPLDFHYVKKHNVAVASDGWTILAIDIETKSHWIVLERWWFQHAISCVHPDCGDLILHAQPDDSFWQVDIQARQPERVTLFASHKIADQIMKLAVMDDETHLYVAENSQDGGVTVWKASSSGECVELCRPNGIETYEDDILVTADGLYILVGQLLTTVLRKNNYLPEHRTIDFGGPGQPLALAGLSRKLIYPSLSGNCLFARCLDNCSNEFRMVHVSLDTMELQVCHVLGIDVQDEYMVYCVNNRELIVLRPSHPEWFQRRTLSVWTAPLRHMQSNRSPPTATSFSFQQELQTVTFLLATGEKLYMDRRLLMAKSAYHSRALSSGLSEDTTNVIDLSQDADATEPAFTAVLKFIYFGTWACSSTDLDLALQIRRLADRYELPDLQVMAEDRIHGLLNEETLLRVLVELDGSSSWLEDWCWNLLDRLPDRVMFNAEANLEELMKDRPDFVKKVILRFACALKRPVPMSRPRFLDDGREIEII